MSVGMKKINICISQGKNSMSKNPGHAGKEGLQLARTGASQGFPRCIAPSPHIKIPANYRTMICFSTVLNSPKKQSHHQQGWPVPLWYKWPWPRRRSQVAAKWLLRAPSNDVLCGCGSQGQRYGVTQNWTRLKRLSSSSRSINNVKIGRASCRERV